MGQMESKKMTSSALLLCIGHPTLPLWVGERMGSPLCK
jgi:hypothetical protein